MVLRPYQQQAFDSAVAWMRRSVMPGLIESATGSGKSHIVASIADWVFKNTGKRVLCLQPSKELTEQNHEKYLATGNKASIFSASAGGKCMRHPVVYGTPGTVKNSLSRFGDQFGAVIVDEAHGVTPTIKMIIANMQRANPKLRVLGLTATPYRTQSGYIYQYDVDGRFVDENQARDPYFNSLLYRITTGELIDMAYLTPAHADPDHAQGYDAEGLELNSRGQFDAQDIERVFEGKGRLTSEIVADIARHAHNRKGVMIFAATVQHAKEIMDSLPPDNSRMLGGDVNMGKTEREKLINDFKVQRFKYLVSVGTLTTGFDAPHVDLIAIMRSTESPGLMQQIIGRGLRLGDPLSAGDHAAIAASDKPDCLVLDYAQNIERHGLHDDLFKPTIRVKGPGGDGVPVPVVCPDCGYENEFSLRPDYADMPRDENGYVLDLEGERLGTDHGPMPAHFGRRCTGQVKDPAQPGIYMRCGHRWTFKECLECSAENDIAARYCSSCKCEIVDPNEKLSREFIRVKKDPYAISTDLVLSWNARAHTSQSGKDVVRCDYQTEYRSFTIYYTPESRHPSAVRAWESLCKAVYRGHIAPSADVFLQYLSKGTAPETITYRKQRGSDFFEAIDHNRPADKVPKTED